MKPPILQTAWHNRVFCPLETPGTGSESFVVAVVSPDAKGALWLDFRLAQAPTKGPGEPFAEVAATWVCPKDGSVRTMRQRLPPARVGIDPERAGVGIGECLLTEGATSGRVSDAQGSIAWDLRWAPQAAYTPLGDEAAHEDGKHSAHQWCAAAGARAPALAAGRVEHWPTHGRHVTAHTTHLTGWPAVQVHRWHHSRQELARALPMAWLWAAAAPQDGLPAARLVALATPARGMVGRRHILLAHLWRGEESWAFDTPAELRRSGQTELNPLAWSFQAQGPKGTLTCRLDLPATGPAPEKLTAQGRPAATRLTAHTQGLEAELCPNGQPAERLRFGQALCEQLTL